MTYNDIWRRLAKLYSDNEAKAIIRLLLEEKFNFSLTDIVCGAVDALPDSSCLKLEQDLVRLEKGEPIQYVLGSCMFFGRRFNVAPGVLIPRPETEQLCKFVIEGMKRTGNPQILDIGTGSGCIASTLSLDIPQASITAWDISAKALEIASDNAGRLGAHVEFVRQDALNAPTDSNLWDAIVSNPPYICYKEKAAMEKNVLDNEPHLALFVPDDDPLLFYRHISEYAVKALKRNGMLFFEINERYGETTAEMLHRLGFKDIKTIKDIFGKDRNIICRRG